MAESLGPGNLFSRALAATISAAQPFEVTTPAASSSDDASSSILITTKQESDVRRDIPLIPDDVFKAAITEIVARYHDNEIASFERFIGVDANTSSYEKIERAFKKVLGSNYQIYPRLFQRRMTNFTQVEKSDLVTFYGNQFEEQLKPGRLSLWKVLREGQEYLEAHTEVRELSGSALKVAFNTWLDGRDLDQVVELSLFLFDGNEMFLLPPEVSRLTELRELTIFGGKFSTISKEIGSLTELRILHLVSDNLKALPDEMENLERLESLILQGQLDSLPNWIGNLRQLQNLVLRKNNLQSLPRELGLLTRLNILNLVDNNFETVPECVSNLRELRFFYLEGNNLQTIPEWIEHLTHLQEFTLDYNKLRVLPASIMRLLELRTLNLTGNDQLQMSDAVRAFVKPLQPQRLEAEREQRLETEARRNAMIRETIIVACLGLINALLYLGIIEAIDHWNREDID